MDHIFESETKKYEEIEDWGTRAFLREGDAIAAACATLTHHGNLA